MDRHATFAPDTQILGREPLDDTQCANLTWQRRFAARICGSVRSPTGALAGTAVSRCLRQRASPTERLRLARNPKCRILTKPGGKMWRRKRRINSGASKVIVLLRLLSLESRQRKLTRPCSQFSSRPFEIKDAPYPDTVKSLRHVAFEVDDLARALEGKEILVEPNCPCPGEVIVFVRAMVSSLPAFL